MRNSKHEKGRSYLSIFLLILFLTSHFGQYVYAGNGGPRQPESAEFKPIGITNLVQPFTGDFSYTIPLLDVEGFPINLNYMGGAGMDEDASWVGLGWNLNTGSVNRQMRGIPDEFNGKDTMTKHFTSKPNVTIGLQLTGNKQILNNQTLKRKFLLGMSLGFFYNNYNGFGSELGISPTFSLTKSANGDLNDFPNLRLGLSSNSQSGIDISPKLSFIARNKFTESKGLGISGDIGTSFNSREGMKEVKFSATINKRLNKGLTLQHKGDMSLLSFGSPSYTPVAQFPTYNETYALSAKAHGTFMIFDAGIEAMGYMARQGVSQNRIDRGMYGFFHLDSAKYDLRGLLDFNREKDVEYNENVPVLATPNLTYDLFVVNQPDQSNQFRGYRTNTGVLYDGSTQSYSQSMNLGAEFGGGNVVQAGATINTTIGGTYTGKWVDNNQFLKVGDFENFQKSNLLAENYYLKATDELTEVNTVFENEIAGKAAVNVKLGGEGSSSFATTSLTNGAKQNLVRQNAIASNPSPNATERINARSSNLTFLQKIERQLYGFDKSIRSYNLNQANYNTTVQEIENPNAKDHHISEVSVLNDEGRRAIYGIPVYNNFQKEVLFSTNGPQYTTGLGPFFDTENSLENVSGKDHFYSSELTPGYAHTWLLTSLLSPDYQDKTGDGISDDDLGSAHKLNYTRVHGNYHWRIPAANAANMGTFNTGLMADPEDNKISYSEGTREEWYNHSVESKNMIAIFFLSNRSDAIGSHTTGLHYASVKMKLDSIKLYSKADLKSGYAQATPIKSVHFEYDYTLCQGIPNSQAGGKLTLKKIYFKFGTLRKGQNFNTYSFQYAFNPSYHAKNIDRWALYKNREENINSIPNDYFPYTNQDPNKTNQYAAAWQLSKIKLPSGGEINIEYESDDYAYVQNKRAAYMQPLTGLSAKIDCQNTGCYPLPGCDDPADCDYNSSRIYQNELLVKTLNLILHFDLPVQVNTREQFANLYLKDPYNPKFLEKLYFRTRMRLHNASLDEFVSGYADIEDYGVRQENGVKKGWIKLKKVKYDAAIEGYHPFAYAGWQLLKTNIPTKAYPFSQIVDPSNPLQAIMSLASLIDNIQEMLLGYGSIAETHRYGQNCTPNHTFIRLLKPDQIKLGGGNRVKRITMTDHWSQLVKGQNESAIYGQEYEYRKTSNGALISSGVAEYEPLLGGEENPMRMPLNYVGPHGLFAHGTRNHIDEPICEALFPSPKVGYSEVKVTSINSIGKNMGTGSQIYQYYTAKDFPIRADRTDLSGNNVKTFQPNLISKFLKIDDQKGIFLSQGFTVETTDMHGKPKAEITLNQENKIIKETNYHYQQRPTSTGELVLDNLVPTINEKNQIVNKSMGVDYDFYTDMRNQSTRLQQMDMELGGGGFILPIAIPAFIPHFMPFPPYGLMQSKFFSSASVKHIHSKGILTKVENNTDGSWITTENKLWDRNNGKVVLNSVTNEFKDKIYQLNYPAYWTYEGMGFAYKNLGLYFGDVVISNGELLSSQQPNIQDIIKEGDEVILKVQVFSDSPSYEAVRCWVVKDPVVNGKKLIVDREGDIVKAYTGDLKIDRSGRRNILQPSVFSASMFENPASSNGLQLSSSNKILSTKIASFKEEWKKVDDTKITTIKCVNSQAEQNFIRTNSKSLFDSKLSTIENWLKP